MWDGAPPASLLRRTLRALRSPFRPGSPFHLASLKRSVKFSVSDGDIARTVRTMRKKNKKRAESIGAASRSTDSSPTVEKKKPSGLLKRMSNMGKRRGDSSTPTSLSEDPESEIDQVPPQEVVLHPDQAQKSETKRKINLLTSNESTTDKSDETKNEPEVNSKNKVSAEIETKTAPAVKARIEVKTEQLIQIEPEIKKEVPTKMYSENKINTEPEKKVNTEQNLVPEKQEMNVDKKDTNEPSASPEPPFIPIAVEHPVAMRAFTKEAWKRRKPEIVKPVEEPSPGNAFKRRIAFVAQTSVALSEDRDDDDDDDDAEGEDGEVGSLEEAVALARQRLAAAHSPADADAADTATADDSEEGAPPDMPAYGDLIEEGRDDEVSSVEARSAAGRAL